MKTTILILMLMAASAVFADSLLVTVAYNKGAYSIKHVEMLAGATPGYSANGDLFLGYEMPDKVIVATFFDMPIIYSGTNSVKANDSVEYALEIPIQQGAEAVSIYNMSGNQLATFSLSGISKAGDAKGTAPTGSIAAQTGEISVAKAVAKSEGLTSTTSTGTTTTTTTGQQTQTTGTTDTGTAKGGLCLITYMVPALGAAAAYRKYKK
jgi:hypothetical protein